MKSSFAVALRTSRPRLSRAPGACSVVERGVWTRAVLGRVAFFGAALWCCLERADTRGADALAEPCALL
jgi:hypothetical protein